MPISATELARGVSQLVSLPDVCLQVNQMAEDETCSAEDMARVVQRDPALTSQLLRIANSAYYGLTAKVETVTRAITIIGNRELRDLVLATSVINNFATLAGDRAFLEAYWRHSVRVGCIARTLAQGAATRVLHSERLFVAGLLHDIGRLVMAVRIPELLRVMVALSRSKRIPMREAERLVFDLDHGEVGAALLADWELPEVMVEAAAWHHEPERAEAFPMEVALVHVADALAHDRVDEVQEGCWALLGMDARRARRLVRDGESKAEAMSGGLLSRG